jgi:predicted DNA binding CopG/RHH family protein
MTTGKPLERMTEEDEAEYFYANREEFERNAKTPVSLERVVSTRFSQDELKHIGEAADAAGMKLSTYIRKAAVEAAAAKTRCPLRHVSDLRLHRTRLSACRSGTLRPGQCRGCRLMSWRTMTFRWISLVPSPTIIRGASRK